MQTVNLLPKAFRELPVVAEILAQQMHKDFQEAKELCAERAQIRGQVKKGLPKLLGARADAEKAVHAATEALKEEQENLMKIRVEIWGLCDPVEHRCTEIDGEVAELSSVKILEFVGEIDNYKELIRQRLDSRPSDFDDKRSQSRRLTALRERAMGFQLQAVEHIDRILQPLRDELATEKGS